MAKEIYIPWHTGEGSIHLSYEGTGDGTLILSSTIANEGVDRTQRLMVATAGKEVQRTITVMQPGRRESFGVSDGLFIPSDGQSFNVIKQGYEL